MVFQLKGLEDDKARILEGNCSMAQENVDKEPEIVERKSRLSALSEEGKELCSVVQEKLNTLSESELYVKSDRSDSNCLIFVSQFY